MPPDCTIFGFSHHVVQGLVRGLHTPRFDPRCHRFHAFAITRQDQTGAIGAERRRTIGMTQRCSQGLDIRLEPRFNAARTEPETHARLHK